MTLAIVKKDRVINHYALERGINQPYMALRKSEIIKNIVILRENHKNNNGLRLLPLL